MKKIMALLFAAIFTASVFTACGTNNMASQGNSGASNSVKATKDENISDKKLSVYTSFYAMYDFTKKVGGDKINISNLVPAGTEPHEWEPSTADMGNLEKADVLVLNGASMEGWADKVVGSLENKNLTVVKASDGMNLLAGHKDEDGETLEYDPHVWLSPRKAKQEMENIKNALVKADAVNKDTYEANYEKYAKEFDDLDAQYRDTISKLSKKNIIVAHEAYGYLCKEYGLNQVAIEGLSADSEPDPSRMAKIIDFAKKNNVKTIFFEELVSPKVAETIASSVGAKTAVFNPLEGLSDEDQAQGKEYVSVMKGNLQVLKTALQ